VTAADVVGLGSAEAADDVSNAAAGCVACDETALGCALLSPDDVSFEQLQKRSAPAPRLNANAPTPNPSRPKCRLIIRVALPPSNRLSNAPVRRALPENDIAFEPCNRKYDAA
jgi:hypothetical protein